jgi:outer membrane protein TolC
MLRALMRSLVAVLALVAGSFTVRATARAEPPAETLTLKEALARAARGNIDLRRQDVALRTSEANVVAALGKFDFVLAADGTFTRGYVAPVHAGDLAAGSTESLVFDLSLARALETGGQLSLSAQARGITTTSNFTCGVAPGTTASCNVYQPSVSLAFTHPLLRGFGREIAEANLRKQRITESLALLNRQAHAANDVRDTIIAYWELAYQTQDLAIRHAAEDLARDQLRITDAQIKVGKLGALSAAAVKRAIAQAQQDTATSEQQLMGRALDLERLFGVPVPRGFAGLVAADLPSAAAHAIDVDAETDRALAASPALKSLQQGLALSDIDVRVALASLRPQLDLAASIGRVGRNTDLAESLRQLGRSDDNVYSAGLTFSLPVQNRAARGAAEVANATRDSARLDAEDLALAIRDGVARFASQIRAAGARIGLARDAVRFAEDNLTAESARFQVGTATNNDVLMRQQELKQAQIAVARAIVDLLEADVGLSALTGDILETYGITLRP